MVLAALQQAGILDEIFVTVTDIYIEPSEHTEGSANPPPGTKARLSDRRGPHHDGSRPPLPVVAIE